MTFFSTRYDSGMDTEKSRELWDRLDNESERAHRAFRTFLNLPSNDRTVVEAYRDHVNNSRAPKPSDTWTRWSREFAWAERASAYDDHLVSLRREAYERGIEEEAERQGALAERNRNRFNELMTVGYEAAMRSLEELVEGGGMRPAEAIQITRLHLEAVKAFGVAEEPKGEDDWTEEDDKEFDDLLREVQAEENPEEGSGDDPSEESEGEET
jgi:hypothetical protein